MTTAKKAIVANYSNDVITNLVNEYKASRQKGQDNSAILAQLAAKYGRTIPSLRAKLASLKVYVKDVETSANASVEKAKKSDLVLGLESLTGLSLASLESATKAELLSLAEYLDDLLATIHELKKAL